MKVNYYLGQKDYVRYVSVNIYVYSIYIYFICSGPLLKSYNRKNKAFGFSNNEIISFFKDLKLRNKVPYILHNLSTLYMYMCMHLIYIIHINVYTNINYIYKYKYKYIYV